jgi:kinesin family protein 5
VTPFRHSARKLLDDVFNGFNATIMTYGQTGSGKTFTMEGPDFSMKYHSTDSVQKELEKRLAIATKMNSGAETESDAKQLCSGLGQLAGLVPRLAQDLFEMVEDAARLDGCKVTVEASFVEIYCGKLYDCLNGRSEGVKMKVPHANTKNSGFSEDAEGPRLKGHMHRLCNTGEDLLAAFVEGVKNKTIAETNANPVSSRGHSVFDIRVTQERGDMNTVSSLFRICDLAGSEMSESTGEKVERRREAKFINTSLTFLGAVVMGLSKGDKFIAYREDLLTRVLEESLGGNSKTLLIVTSSPMAKDCKTTLKSLRFASTANQVRRSIVKNEGVSKKQLERAMNLKEAELRKKDEEVRALQELADDALSMKDTIARLKNKLANSHKNTEERVAKLKFEHEASQAHLTKYRSNLTKFLARISHLAHSRLTPTYSPTRCCLQEARGGAGQDAGGDGSGALGTGGFQARDHGRLPSSHQRPGGQAARCPKRQRAFGPPGSAAVGIRKQPRFLCEH